jgi:hypothetical protein
MQSLFGGSNTITSGAKDTVVSIPYFFYSLAISERINSALS